MADEANEAENEAPEAGGGKKKIIVIVLAVLVLAGGAFAGMTFLGEEEPVDGEEAAAETTQDPPIYTSLHPPLVVNFKDEAGDPHYMQITMEVMARDQGVANSIREHTAVIRNALILHYSSARYEVVTTRDGKEAMLAEGLAEIQDVLTAEIGEPGAEALYFTALVIQ